MFDLVAELAAGAGRRARRTSGGWLTVEEEAVDASGLRVPDEAR